MMIVLYRFFLFLLPLFSLVAKNSKDNKQIFHINLSEAHKSLHPQMSRDTSSITICKALYEGLTRVNLEGKVELALAKKIEVSKCKTKYTIYLRPSKWSNGKTLVAADFVDAWKSAVKPNTRCVQPYRFFSIKNAEKVFLGKLSLDDLGLHAPRKDKIIIHLEHPAPYFTQLLADPIYSPLFDTSDSEKQIFNGSFIIDAFYPSKEILLKKNPLYWDEKGVKLDKIVISLVQDPLTAYELFQKGKLDFIGSPFTDLPEEIIFNIAKQLKSKKACALHWLHMNTKHPKLRSKNIRKALSLSINREHIANYILPNATVNNLIIPEELSSLEVYYRREKNEQVQELFMEGLKEIGDQKKDFSITINCSSIQRHACLAEYLKNQWEKSFGIRVIIDKSDWSTFFSKLNSRNFCIGGTTRYTSFESPLYFLEYFYHAKSNYSKWENKKFQKWIDLANQTISEKLRRKYLAKAEEILEEECPVIPVYTHKHLYLCNPDLKGFYPSRLAYTDFKWTYFQKK